MTDDFEVSNDENRTIGTKKRKLIIVIVIIVILVLIGVAVAVLYPSEPDMDVRSIRIENVEWDEGAILSQPESLHITLDIAITNPNVIGATVDRTGGEVFLEGDYTGDFSVPAGFDVPGDGTVVVTVDFYLKDLPNPIKVGNILMKDKVDIRVKGSVVISFGLADFTMDFDETKTVSNFL